MGADDLLPSTFYIGCKIIISTYRQDFLDLMKSQTLYHKSPICQQKIEENL